MKNESDLEVKKHIQTHEFNFEKKKHERLA